MQTIVQTRMNELLTAPPDAAGSQSIQHAQDQNFFQNHLLSALQNIQETPVLSGLVENSADHFEQHELMTEKFLNHLNAPSMESLREAGLPTTPGGALNEVVVTMGAQHHDLIAAISNSSALDERLQHAREFRSKVGDALTQSGHQVSMHADADKLVVNGRVVDILSSLYSPGRSTAVQVLDLGAHDPSASVRADLNTRDPGVNAGMETRVNAVLDAVKNSSAGKAALSALSSAPDLPTRRPHANAFNRLVIAEINALQGLSARDGNGKDKIYIRDGNGAERYYDLIRNADGPGTATVHLLHLSNT